MRRQPYRVDPAVRERVLRRDGACLLSRVEPGHVCRDIWGNEHRADDLDRQTLEHVKDELMAGKRAPSDEQHMVTLCGLANFRVPSKSQRGAFRSYLAAIYGKAAAA